MHFIGFGNNMLLYKVSSLRLWQGRLTVTGETDDERVMTNPPGTEEVRSADSECGPLHSSPPMDCHLTEEWQHSSRQRRWRSVCVWQMFPAHTYSTFSHTEDLHLVFTLNIACFNALGLKLNPSTKCEFIRCLFDFKVKVWQINNFPKGSHKTINSQV